MAKRSSRKINGKVVAGTAAGYTAVAWLIERQFRMGSTEDVRIANARSQRDYIAARALTYGGIGLLGGVISMKYHSAVGVGLMLGAGLTAASVSFAEPPPAPQLNAGQPASNPAP